MTKSFGILQNLGLISPNDIETGRALLARRDRILAESKGVRPAEDNDAAIDRLIAGETTVYEEALQIAHQDHAELIAEQAATKILSQVLNIMRKRRPEVEPALNEVIGEAVEQATAGFRALGGITDAAQAIDSGLADAWQNTVNAERIVAQVHKDAATLREAGLCWAPRYADRSHFATRYRRQPTAHHDWTIFQPYVPASAEEFEDAANHHALAGGGWAGDDAN
jgi:hypothetical protein